MKNRNHITADELWSLVNYDPETGLFTDKAGAPVGFQHPAGYWQLELGGKLYRANRLAWLYVMGREPVGVIDHRDFDPTNDAFSNLREASGVESMRHRRINAGKPLRMKGVRLARNGAYQARISYGGKQHSLGFHDTPDEAGHAYNKAAIKHFGDYAVLNPVGRSNYGPRGVLPERRRYLNEAKEKRPRGFAAMTPERRKEIAQRAGKAAQATGKAHRYSADNPAEASEAGKRGSASLHAKNRAMREKLARDEKDDKENGNG